MKNEIGSQGQNAAEASRTEVALPDVYVHPLLTYYPPTGIVERGGEQFSVLPERKRDGFNALFLPHPNTAISVEKIIESGYTNSYDIGGVRVWISHLRKYLSPDPEEAKQIVVTVNGNYIFRDESKPVELIQKDTKYVDFHVRVKRENADQFESIMDQFGRLVTARRLDAGAEAVLFVGENATEVRGSALHYPEPEIDPDLPILDGGDFKFDPNRQVLVVGDKSIHLAPNEAKYAYLLMVNSGRLVTQERIRLFLQNIDGEVSEHAHVVYLSKIRTKLRQNIEDFSDPFETVKEKGIIFHGPPKTVE